ncbi:hypothetical protein BDP55DRAFT_384594 [Colletotrichum godetiae]|uniref:Uncharacterized protein n=1 Tax=Colletotrichum godetiae TaxID=1209918 RepID=A0AAJ0F1Y4_9PEZI|nr:uncharacterized protein BDP55DRAFT_384594 [Colletotrichum godetiae]KAK1689952.1 hypothetical protein BDP55DRAFT_384594 [Colletotrichum godetiae]
MNPPVTRQDLRCPRRSMRTSTVRSPQCKSFQRAPAGTYHVHHQALPQSLDSIVPQLLFLESASSSNTFTSYSSIHFGAMASLWHSRSHTDLTFRQYQPRYVVNERFNPPTDTAPNPWRCLTRSVWTSFKLGHPLHPSTPLHVYVGHCQVPIGTAASASLCNAICVHALTTDSGPLSRQGGPGAPAIQQNKVAPLVPVQLQHVFVSSTTCHPRSASFRSSIGGGNLPEPSSVFLLT